MFDDLIDDNSDVAMCAIWLYDYENKYDMSTYHNHECNTLLVPKPRRLSEITAIYTTLSGEVWVICLSFFFITGILLWSSAKIGIVEKTVYENIARSFLEVMNIATSHGVVQFPSQHSIKMLLLR